MKKQFLHIQRWLLKKQFFEVTTNINKKKVSGKLNLQLTLEAVLNLLISFFLALFAPVSAL
ncbi:MAG: hypothetical protein RSD75_07370 [Mucinivorans sp.]